MCKVVQLGSTTTTTAAATVPLASWEPSLPGLACLQAWHIYTHMDARARARDSRVQRGLK